MSNLEMTIGKHYSFEVDPDTKGMGKYLGFYQEVETIFFVFELFHLGTEYGSPIHAFINEDTKLYKVIRNYYTFAKEEVPLNYKYYVRKRTQISERMTLKNMSLETLLFYYN